MASSLPDVGTKLHARYADDGDFYAAEVVDVSTSKKRAKAPVKVEFKGWEGDGYWVSMDSLKSRALGLKGETKATKDKPAKVKPAELPSIGAKVRVQGSGAKASSGQVIDAQLHVRLSDGTTKWCSVDELKFESAIVTPDFECQDCGQQFRTEVGRDNHWWDVHIVTCSECGRLFDNETLRDEHWWDAHIEYCKQCGKICSNMGELVEHTRAEHAMRCKQCGKMCSSIRLLVQHARDAHQYKQNLIDLDGRKAT
jgi:DNA-directed RNA polymerase subunit RPC12/RpoP|eukprot:TRINITY_DN48724_c0_g1_i1.p1 TRINITY_DN48724_c0_g1~~TRINITY_DN48724_c0_g1_i1.p1  ORF type:complete len:292 (-),score=49.39 TRINITY_DN48724_c0_g1_i1:196-957(-)